MPNNLIAQTGSVREVLEKGYETSRFCNMPLRSLKHAQVESLLTRLKTSFPESFVYEKTGTSVQNRAVYLVRMGVGKTKILLWSQMHGDEPTATAALFDIFNFLLKNADLPFVKEILDNVTILAVPMLNPDGAETYKRRNAQDIDINRDARDLQTPEGRILFGLKEKYQPDFGFNLHDQNSRRTVGKTNKLAAIALMAPPYDAEDSDNPVRIRAKKVVSVIYEALGPYLYGHISKYDADYMPRAFGDAMQSWGVSTILVESGGWYRDRDEVLQKMNFIALLTAFDAIATGRYKKANPAVYDHLDENGEEIFDLLIKDVTVLDGTGIPAFSTDIAINYDTKKVGTIEDIGDLELSASRDTVDGKGLIMTPGFVGIIRDTEPWESGVDGRLNRMLEQGYTTALFTLSRDMLKHINGELKKLQEQAIPLNTGGVLILENEPDTDANTLAALKYILRNPLSLGKNGRAEPDSTLFGYIERPVVNISEFEPLPDEWMMDADRIKKVTFERCSKLKIPKRGRIQRGMVADFLLFSKEGPAPRMKSVYLKGHPVWLDGTLKKTEIRGERWF